VARYANLDPLYAIYENFKTNCLLNDRSFFLPDQKIWTVEAVSALKRRLVDNPEWSNESFETKLTKQMYNASAEEWVILAEAHLIYYLPPSNHTVINRRDTTLGYLRNSYVQLTQLPTDDFWASITGFCHVGQQYNLRFKQIWLILMFAEAVKKSSDRAALLSDPQAMKTLIDDLLQNLPKGDRARDMRHSLLYLAFPDHYEPILSNNHREQILKTYRKRFAITEPDNDLALLEAHNRLSQDMGVAPDEIHFYWDGLKAEWQGDTSAPPIETEVITAQVAASELETSLDDPEVTKGLKKLAFTKNLIFTGAPGTGKTYTAQRVANALVEVQVRKTVMQPRPTNNHELPLNVLEELHRHEVIALSFYQQPSVSRFTNSQVLNLPMVKQYEKLKSVKAPSSVIGTALGMRIKPGNPYSNLSYTQEPYIFDRDAKGWFLSPEGRQYVEQELADYLEMMKRPVDVRKRSEDYIQIVAFHPSYAYEDFVEGMRPVVDDAGNLSYEIRPGILRVMCSRAAADPENRYVLIIDEINRANLSKVFGELITLIEDDKRLGTSNALTLKLPYSGDSFGVPNNLYFIGTLNTADRSIALMDVAMRRRFAFVDVPPRPDLLGTTIDTTGSGLEFNLAAMLYVLNGRIRQHIGRSHEIGHSYFMNIRDNQSGHLEHVWNTQILPLLEEYFYSRADTLREVLQEFVLDEETDERFGYAEGEDLMTALGKMAKNYSK